MNALTVALEPGEQWRLSAVAQAMCADGAGRGALRELLDAVTAAGPRASNEWRAAETLTLTTASASALDGALDRAGAGALRRFHQRLRGALSA